MKIVYTTNVGAVTSLKSLMTEPPLVGRQHELEELMLFLDSTMHGKGKTVFITGEAGAGKTRLIKKFLNMANEKQIALLSGRCYSDVAAPYFPFMEAFDSYFQTTNKETAPPAKPTHQSGSEQVEQAENEEAQIKAWLAGPKQTGKISRFENLTPQAWKELAVVAVTKALLAIASKKPTILFIDDLHWADSASLALLHYISQSIDSSRVLVLATYRSEELIDDEEGHRHPLVETLRIMNREDLYTEIKLANLDQNCISEVAEKILGGPLHPEFAAKLASESQGNPLFIVESLRFLVESAGLVEDKGQWLLSVGEVGIPPKIKNIILRRVDLLKPAQKRVLDLASAIGDRFDIELLGAVLGQDSLEVLETLNAVANSSSLVCSEGNYFKFDHSKIREAIYGEISTPLKKGYHARIAETIEAKFKGFKNIPVNELAYHYGQSGNKEKAIEYSLIAGEAALAQFSNIEALKHFNYVLDVASNFPEYSDKKSIALEMIGDSLSANCKFNQALEVYEHLISLETGKVKLRAYRKAIEAIIRGSAKLKKGVELAKQAEPYLIFDRLENARIAFKKLAMQKPGLEGYLDRHKQNAEILQIFEQEYSLPDVADVLEVSSLNEINWVSKENGLSQTMRSLVMHKELYGDSLELAIVTWWATGNLLAAGLIQESKDKLNEAIQICEKVKDYAHLASCYVTLGRLLEVWGQTEEALSMSLQGLKYYEKTEGRQNIRVLADLARQNAKLGNLERAEEWLKLWKNQPVDMPLVDPQGLLSQRDDLRSEAVFFAAKNRWEEAFQTLERALEIAKKIPLFNVFSQIVVRTDYAWVLNKQGRIEEAKVHLEEIKKLLDEVDQRFAHVNVDVHLMSPWNVVAGDVFEMRLDLVNISRKHGMLINVKELLPAEFEIVNSPEDYATRNGFIDLREEEIGPFEVETIKLKLKAAKAGTYAISPQVTYMDEKQETGTCKTNPITITVKPAKPKFEVLPGRVSTGLEELDALLFGGIPEKYAVVLTSEATEEKELLVKRFLEVGAAAGETTFQITTQAGNSQALAEKYASNFSLFVCNPQVDAIVQDLPNLFKLKGTENLTDIDIALTKAFRKLNPAEKGGKRICIELLSDILLQHHAINTRRWLSALLPTLKSKGFTILAVIDPQMHPREELQAVLGVFDGEIRVTQKETPEGIKQILRVRKLINQKYQENEVALSREKLEV